MADLANGDLVEVRVVCQLGDQVGINIHHYRCHSFTSVAGAVTTVDACKKLALEFGAYYSPCMSQNALYYGAGVRRLLPTLSLEDGWAGNAEIGTVISPPLPAQLSGLVAVLDGLGGRQHKGRRFIPFPAQSTLDITGRPDATYRANIAAIGDYLLAGEIITGLGGSTINLTAVLKHAADTHNDLVSIAARLQWGTQRSRGGYGRPNTLPVWPS